MRFKGALTVIGLACLAVAAGMVYLPAGIATVGAGLIWMARA